MTATSPVADVPGTPAGAPAGAGRPPAQRLVFLDALRGVAALLVVLQHGGEQLSAGFRQLSAHVVQLGQLGVLTFFLVSGFVIPLSLGRSSIRRPSLRRFAVTRAARLYPAYWASLLLTVLTWHLVAGSRPAAAPRGPAQWLVESTMLQSFVGVPQAQGQYWSLAFELLFYVLAGVLVALRLQRHSVALALGALAVAVGAHALARATGHTVPLGLGNVATMFVGTVLYRVHTGEVSARTGWRVYALGALAAELVLVLRLTGRTDASTGGTLTLGPMATAWGGAYAFVAVAFVLRTREVPRWLAWTGLVSYSVYLLHPLVMDAAGRLPGGAGPTLVGWVGLTLLAGAASYSLVEAPGVRAGRRLAGRLTRPPRE